jgi:hypothetical protein
MLVLNWLSPPGTAVRRMQTWEEAQDDGSYAVCNIGLKDDGEYTVVSNVWNVPSTLNCMNRVRNGGLAADIYFAARTNWGRMFCTVWMFDIG